MKSFANCRSMISSSCRGLALFRLGSRTHGATRLATTIMLGTALVVTLAAPTAAANLGGTVTYKARGMTKPTVLPSVLVSVYHTVTGRKSVTRTNSAGAYLFQNLPSGAYVILVEKDGTRIYQGKIEVQEPAIRF